MDDLRATKSEDVGLIDRAVSFQDFQPICGHDPPTSQTDGQTDRRTEGQTEGQTTCDSKTALCTVVHRAVKWELFFTKHGVKTNWQYCWNIIISQQILDAMKRVINDNFIFQQYSALMLIALDTVQLLQRNTFLSRQWPKMVQSLTPMTTRFREPHSSNIMSCE